MPRQTHGEYLDACRWLTGLWINSPTAFGRVGHQDQRYIHDYFLPSLTMSDDDLLRYRKKISADQPSLPQCAGRALKKLRAAIEEDKIGRPGITVRAVARPSIDDDAIGRVLAKLARELDKQDRNAA